MIASPLEEPGGVCPGPIHAAGKAGVEPIECTLVEAHEPEGASLDANIAPVPTKGIASVEPASGAVEATTARPEALEPREKCTEWSEPQPPPPPQKPPKEGMRMRSLKALPFERAHLRANAGYRGRHKICHEQACGLRIRARHWS